MNTPNSDDHLNDDNALDALFATARRDASDTSRAEFGFETRLRARLGSERTDASGLRELTGMFWWLLPGCAVVALALTLWAAWTPTESLDDQVLSSVVQQTLGDDSEFGFLPSI